MNLTPRAIALGCVILLLGAAGLWAGGIYEGAWRYLALAFAFALFVEGRWAKLAPIEGRWLLPAAPRLGQPDAIVLELTQGGPLPLELHVLLPVPPGARGEAQVRRIALPAAEPVQLRQEFTPVSLGALPAPRAVGRLLGRLRLAWWSRALPEPQPGALDVVPDSLHADERNAAGGLQGEEALLRRGHGLELLGLREYRPGDPLRALAWKASARAERLMVRDTLIDQHLEVAVVIDTGRSSAIRAGALSRLHHFVNVAARFGERSVALGDRLSLVAFGSGITLALTGLHGASGVRRLRAALGQLRTAPVESNPAAAALEVRRLLRHRGLVVWLGDPDTDTGALAAVAGVLARQHVALFAQILDPDVLAELDRPAGGWLDPYVAVAAQQMSAQQALSARRLTHLGCDVVSATAADIERRLLDAYVRLRARRRV